MTAQPSLTALPNLTDCLLELDDGVATLTLNRHDVRNAVTGSAIIDDIIAVTDWVNRDQNIKVVIITGAGSAFCAGGNIKDMVDKGPDFGGDPHRVAETYRHGVQRMPLAMHACEAPIIAAVNGAAVGAGFDLMNMCDVRLISSKAKMGETFVNLGIIPGDGGAWFLQRLIGYQRAAELTLSGRMITADEALEYGLALEVLAPDQLMPRAYAMARDMASKPTTALRLTKRLLKAAQRTELADFLDLCAIFQGVCHNEDEHMQAVTAMLERISSK